MAALAEMKALKIVFTLFFILTTFQCIAQEQVKVKGNSLISGVQLFPEREPDGFRGKALKVVFTKPLAQNRKLKYTMKFTSKSGFVYEHAGTFHTAFTASEPKDFRLVNLYLSIGRHDPTEKREKLKAEIVPGNVKTMELVVKETTNGFFSSKTSTVISHTFENL